MTVLKLLKLKSLLLFLAVVGIAHAQDTRAVPNIRNPRAVQEESIQTSSDATLLFSSSAVIHKNLELVNGVLRKGSTLQWPAKKDNRYAVLVRSNVLDTVVRLSADSLVVYRDIYLGELAGIVFSPPEDFLVQITAFASEHRSVATEGNEDNVAEGKYSIEVYKVEQEPFPIASLPYQRAGILTSEQSLAFRIAHEYRLFLNKDQRVYLYMNSEEIDPLLEIADRYGKSVIVDDWQNKESIITMLAPKSDEYFVTTTSFTGTETGSYTLSLQTTNNTIVLEDNNNVSHKDKKLLSYYAKQYDVQMEKGSFYSLETQAWDGDIRIVFADSTLQSIVEYRVREGEKQTVPLYAEEGGLYSLLYLSSRAAAVNYTFSLRR